MKYRRKVFEMNDTELVCVVQNLVLPDAARHTAQPTPTRAELQEDIVQWLMSQGLGIRHNFLFFEDDQSSPTTLAGRSVAESNEESTFRRRSIYLLKGMHDCECCRRGGADSPVCTAQTSSSTGANSANCMESPRKYVPSPDSLRNALYAIPNGQQQPPKRPTDLNVGPKQTNPPRYYEHADWSKTQPPTNGRVIRTQPTRGGDKGKIHRDVPSSKSRKADKGNAIHFDCCCCKSYFVECGRFCVEILRGS